MTFDLDNETHVRAFALQLAAPYPDHALELADEWADFIIHGDVNAGGLTRYGQAVEDIVSGRYILSMDDAEQVHARARALFDAASVA